MSRYFLIPFLPELKFETSPEISSQELLFYLQQNLSRSEMQDVDRLQTLQDLENLRSFFLGTPMMVQGSISHEELVIALRDPEFIPRGAEVFYKTYKTLSDRQKYAHELIHSFLKNQKKPAGFVHRYFRFENTCRLVFSWLRAQALQREVTIDPEEIGFDITDTAQWPEPFQELLRIWKTKGGSPSELEAAISQWKFHAVDALCDQEDPFSLDLVFAYIVKLRKLEERQSMNDPRNQKTLQEMVTAHD